MPKAPQRAVSRDWPQCCGLSGSPGSGPRVLCMESRALQPGLAVCQGDPAHQPFSSHQGRRGLLGKEGLWSRGKGDIRWRRPGILEGRGRGWWEPSQACSSLPPGIAKHGPQCQIINLPSGSESLALTSGGSAWISPEVPLGLRGGGRHAMHPVVPGVSAEPDAPWKRWERKGRKPKAGEPAAPWALNEAVQGVVAHPTALT